MAEEAAAKGDAAYRASNFGAAVLYYSDAIELSPGDHLLYSNRSAAYSALNQHRLALADAVMTYYLKPDFPRAYFRLGNAHLGLGRVAPALCAFNIGLKIGPGDADMEAGYERAAARAENTAITPEKKDLLKALEAHPSTKNFPNWADFWSMLIGVAEDPLKANSSDRRLLHALGVLMNLKCRSPDPIDGGSSKMEGREEEAEVNKKFEAEIENYITKTDEDGTEQEKDTPTAGVAADASMTPKLDGEDRKWEPKVEIPLGEHVQQSSQKFLVGKIFKDFNGANMAPLGGDESGKRATVEDLRGYFTRQLQSNPEDPELYGKRSMCHTKLGNFHDGLKDAEKCIELNPSLWIGYHRKGQVLFCTKESDAAVDTYMLGLDRTEKKEELLKAFKKSISDLTGPGTGDRQ